MFKGRWKLSLGSKLKIESKGMFSTLIFYAVVGVIFLALMPMTNFPPHIGIIGIFSLVAAYGVFKKRAWTVWFIVVLFFSGTAFSAFMIGEMMARDYVLGTFMIAYLVLTWIFTAYAIGRRNALES